VDYSIFFFAADYQAAESADPYRLVRESAVFADGAGFRTVWLPERHFHPFGGLYPSPAVIAASLAHITRRIQLWAGSVVAPLNDALRIAEEWALVDRLSRGRAGVSFASGWAVNDFVLGRDRPDGDAYERRRELTLERIAIVKRLWRGETIRLPNGVGKEIDVRIYPLPGRDIPLALTAQSDATAEKAGELGLGLLMNMHYQDVGKLQGRIAAYREQLARHHPGARGHVTVMVHTLLCDAETLRDVALPAYRRYLATNLDMQVELFKGSGIDVGKLTRDDLEFVIARAAERMIGSVGLIGPPEACRERAAAYAAAGVDEIACLIDFGGDFPSVMRGLELIAQHLIG
jgi:natural product biosynthesis luciferase-like monooxygenase protein